MLKSFSGFCSGIIAALLLTVSVPLLHGGDYPGKWMKIESPNYELRTNRPGRGAQTKIIKLLEKARQDFQAYLPVLAPKPGSRRGQVRIFRSRQQYVSAVGKQFEWSAGLWNGKELMISPPANEKNARAARAFIRQVVFHEGFHQFLYIAIPQTYVDMWFNEGCAQFFEDVDARGRVILDNYAEAELVKVTATYHQSAAKLMQLSYKEFYNPKYRSANYRAAHSLIYFLLKGAPALGSKFAKLPEFYITQLQKSRDHRLAMRAVARQFDLKELDRQWRNFWKNRKQRRRAERYIPESARR